MAHQPKKILNSKYIPNVNKRKNNPESDNLEVFHNHFCEISRGKKTTEELILLLIDEIEAKPQFYRHVTMVCRHLDQVMRFFYRDPIVKIEPFGSSDLKLALRDSDIDIFLNFGETLPEAPHDLLRSLKNKVRKYRYFVKAIPIFARVPVLQCTHCSGVSCDISFLNALGVADSHLIKFLLSVDDRLRPLILIIKYLIKRKRLLEPNAITSYTVVILILYFLQTIQNPIIPSISFLQNLANKPKIIADWDVSFSTKTMLLSKICCQLSVTELLQKFFSFYATFEFGFYVISLFTAKTYLKPIFSEPTLLPKEFQLYKKNLAKGEAFKFDWNKPMCVQSPFSHCNNITKNTTHKYLIEFQQFCEDSAAKGREIWDKNDSEEKKLKFLKYLFQENVIKPPKKKLKVNASVCIFMGQNLIFDDPKCSEEDLRNKWFEYVLNSVKDILVKVMKCDIDVHTKAPDNESISSENEKTYIYCVIHYHELVTRKRNKVKCKWEFPPDMPVINQEEVISNFLIETALQSAKKVSVKFEISCSMKKGPTCFFMNFDVKEEKKCNVHLVQQVFQFIQKNFPKWIK